MAWPPAALPTNRTNATPQNTTHPADHNAIAAAINDAVGHVQDIDDALAAVTALAVIVGGQVVSAGSTGTFSFTTLTNPAFVGPANFTFPESGFYILSLRVAGPAPPSGAFHDIVINAGGGGGVTYQTSIAPTKGSGVLTIANQFAAGDPFNCQFFNANATPETYTPALFVTRIPSM